MRVNVYTYIATLIANNLALLFKLIVYIAILISISNFGRIYSYNIYFVAEALRYPAGLSVYLYIFVFRIIVAYIFRKEYEPADKRDAIVMCQRTRGGTGR